MIAEEPLVAAAAVLGVCESRVSQLRQRVRRDIRDGMLLEEKLAEYRDDPDASKLVVDWIKW